MAPVGMRSITTEELQRNFEKWLTIIKEEGPLMLSNEPKESWVLVSYDDYENLMAATTAVFYHRSRYLYLLPDAEYDLNALTDAILKECTVAGLKDPWINDENAPFLAVEVTVEGGRTRIEAANQAIWGPLPQGTLYVQGKDLNPVVEKAINAMGIIDIDEAFDLLFSKSK